jgi:hypothetical protein
MAQISKRKNNFEMKLPIMKIGSGVFLVLFLVIFSCTETDQVLPDSGLDYFPLQVGNYSIYEVNETTILQSVTTEVSYELKVTVSDSTINEKGEITYIIYREKRSSPMDTWESYDTWSAKVINHRLIQNESNINFVKLIFPPSLDLSWDGNQYNNLPYNGGIEIFYDGNDRPYFISELDKSITLTTGFSSDNALTVVQSDYDDVITGRDQRKEVYAKGVGLIYKEINQFIKCTSSICSGDRSYIFIQSLKEYGKR